MHSRPTNPRLLLTAILSSRSSPNTVDLPVLSFCSKLMRKGLSPIHGSLMQAVYHDRHCGGIARCSRQAPLAAVYKGGMGHAICAGMFGGAWHSPRHQLNQQGTGRRKGPAG